MRLLLLVWLRVRDGIVRQAWQIDHVPVGCGPHRATGVRPERPAWVGKGEGSIGDGGVLEDDDRLYRYPPICVGDGRLVLLLVFICLGDTVCYGLSVKEICYGCR